jgi:hypothetical protein
MNNGPAKVYRLLQDSLGPGIWDYPTAKARARAGGGLSKYKVCLGNSLDPQPKRACQIPQCIL